MKNKFIFKFILFNCAQFGFYHSHQKEIFFIFIFHIPSSSAYSCNVVFTEALNLNVIDNDTKPYEQWALSKEDKKKYANVCSRRYRIVHAVGFWNIPRFVYLSHVCVQCTLISVSSCKSFKQNSSPIGCFIPPFNFESCGLKISSCKRRCENKLNFNLSRLTITITFKIITLTMRYFTRVHTHTYTTHPFQSSFSMW